MEPGQVSASSASFFALIPAAGCGARMGSLCSKRAKALLSLPNGLSLLEASISLFVNSNFKAAGRLCGVVAVVRAEDVQQVRRVLQKRFPGEKLIVAPGGTSRQESVFAGLKALADCGRATHVLVHDAARPFCPLSVIKSVAEGCLASGACIAALPAKHSLKQVHGRGIVCTVPREDIWEAQTPQGFKLDLLLKAHEIAGKEGYQGTDDSELVERLGHPVKIVDGAACNLKITTPEDLAYAVAGSTAQELNHQKHIPPEK